MGAEFIVVGDAIYCWYFFGTLREVFGGWYNFAGNNGFLDW